MENLRDFIEFKVNGQKQKVKNNYSFETTLNEYIRDVLHLKGTKITCHEGGCGVCMVNGTYFDQSSNTYKNVAINSCLFPLYSCDNWEFTTVEGLGCKSKKLHPIQKRLADYNGSQCGFCSPGFVMSMYSLLLNDPKPDKQTIENAFDGNLCRCTGYRSILDAMKSFAANETPIDIEDLHQMKCLNNSDTSSSNHECQHASKKSAHLTYNQSKWYAPANMQEFLDVLEKSKTENYKIIAGNTMKGLFKTEVLDQTYINIQNIKELYEISQSDVSLTIGANVTLTRLAEIFESNAKSTDGFEYLTQLSKLVTKVGNTSVRNMSTWSGNLVIKQTYQFFPSDLFVAFKTVDAVLTIKSSTEEMKVKLDDFLKLDLKGKFIYSISFPKYNKAETLVKVFKIMPRSQGSHAYVTAGFKFSVDSQTLIVKDEPKLIFGGIVNPYFESKKAANYLVGKELKSTEVFKESCKLLDSELSGDKAYEKSLAAALYYKFILSILPSTSDLRNKTAVESLLDTREVSRGEQSFPSNPDLYPLTQPIPKTNSYVQTSGEAVYNSDLPPLPGQLNGAFILSKVGNCNIETINIHTALAAPGVVKIILAKDIPGKNDVFPLSSSDKEELFATDFVPYAGHPLGLVIAETERQARYAANLVEVTYKNMQKPILTINDAIEANSFHPKIFNDFIFGNADESINKAPFKLEGEFKTEAQYHFYLENQYASCHPTEDGYEINCSTQWPDYVQKAVAQVLNVHNLSDIDVKTKQIGGGFGGKASRASVYACAAAVASASVKKPVRLFIDLNTNMRTGAKRFPSMFKYTVGFDESGKLHGVKIHWYSDAGFLPIDDFMELAYPFFDNAYLVPNLHVIPYLVKTNTPINTSFRAPFTFPAITAIEYIQDHIASFLKKDAIQVRKLNMYQKSDTTLIGLPLINFNLDALYDNFIKTSDYEKRLNEINLFNKENRWKKRGIAVIPMKYGASWREQFYSTMVSVFNGDGSVAISHGAIEIGQGLNTKIAQVCAHELGIPLDKVTVKSTDNTVSANSQWTGGSVTTEIVAKGIIECCKIIKRNLEPFKALMPENYTWQDLVAKAYQNNVDISARHFVAQDRATTKLLEYDIYAAACSEVILDVLTGETQILRTDILYDCGQPLNGLIDIGQAEGAFIIGLGFWFLERIRYNPENGRCITNGTWDYFPPLSKDIPVDFRVSFLHNNPNPVGILGAKCVGEPPLCLSLSALFACKRAIEAARLEVGNTDHFNLDGPVTPDIIQKLCLTNYSSFNL